MCDAPPARRHIASGWTEPHPSKNCPPPLVAITYHVCWTSCPALTCSLPCCKALLCDPLSRRPVSAQAACSRVVPASCIPVQNVQKCAQVQKSRRSSTSSLELLSHGLFLAKCSSPIRCERSACRTRSFFGFRLVPSPPPLY